MKTRIAVPRTYHPRPEDAVRMVALMVEHNIEVKPFLSKARNGRAVVECWFAGIKKLHSNGYLIERDESVMDRSPVEAVFKLADKLGLKPCQQ